MNVSLMPSSNDNARLVAAIQCASLYFLLCPIDTTNRQATQPNDRPDHGTATCGFSGCDGMWTSGVAGQSFGQRPDGGGAGEGER